MFNSIKAYKASEHIINQIRSAILAGKLKPRDRLPSERQLIQDFHVSKATLREALRSLEILGFLEIKKGVSGGALVTEVSVETARNCFMNYLHFQNLSLKNLSEVRLVLEPCIAGKAALNIGEEGLGRLKGLNEEAACLFKNYNPAASRENEIEFHRTIASISGNPILMFIIDFIEHLLIEAKEILQPGKAFSKKVLKAHKRILRALMERNPEKARQEMIKHVMEVEKDLLALQKAGRFEEIAFQQLSGKELLLRDRGDSPSPRLRYGGDFCTPKKRNTGGRKQNLG